MNILLFGSTGGIGSNVKNILDMDHNVISVTRDVLDFNDHDSAKKINALLNVYAPDIVINCAGVFEGSYEEIFGVNYKSNWDIISHYANDWPVVTIKFIMIGSSAYKKGKKDHMLYSSSKAALFNLYEGATDYFRVRGLNFVIGLVNPIRVNTKMVAHLGADSRNLDPAIVAQKIVDFALGLEASGVYDITND